MHARNDGYWHPSYDNLIEESGSDDGDCITLTYDEFLDNRNESSLWLSTDESQDEDCDLDESDFQRYTKYYEQHYPPSPDNEWTARDKHSCLKLRNGYRYLDPSGYDTRTVRHLSTINKDVPADRSYAPQFIRTAPENTESVNSCSDDRRIDDSMDYNNQQMEDLDNDFYDYSLSPQPRNQISQAVRYSELTRMVENTIYNTEVVIFSKTYCPYCLTAKETFDELEQPYTALELDQRADGEQIQWVIGQLTGGTSVPRVFVNGYFIGGGDDVQRLYESGELQEMLGFQ